MGEAAVIKAFPSFFQIPEIPKFPGLEIKYEIQTR